MDLRRGDVWWVALDSTTGSEINRTRPCVIISAGFLNSRRKTVVVVPLSTTPTARPPLTVPMMIEGRRAVAVTDQIRAVAKERFQRRIGSLTAPYMATLEDGLRDVLDLT